MSWWRGTFSEADGTPSMKRQAGFLLVIGCLVGTFLGTDITTIAFLAGSILGITEIKNIKIK